MFSQIFDVRGTLSLIREGNCLKTTSKIGWDYEMFPDFKEVLSTLEAGEPAVLDHQWKIVARPMVGMERQKIEVSFLVGESMIFEKSDFFALLKDRI